MKISYFDCFSGTSDDMILEALIDAGFSQKILNAEAKQLPLKLVYNAAINAAQLIKGQN